MNVWSQPYKPDRSQQSQPGQNRLPEPKWPLSIFGVDGRTTATPLISQCLSLAVSPPLARSPHTVIPGHTVTVFKNPPSRNPAHVEFKGTVTRGAIHQRSSRVYSNHLFDHDNVKPSHYHRHDYGSSAPHPRLHIDPRSFSQVLLDDFGSRVCDTLPPAFDRANLLVSRCGINYPMNFSVGSGGSRPSHICPCTGPRQA